VGNCQRLQDKVWVDHATENWRDPGFAQNDNHPVVCVNWNDAKAYVAWLTRKSGKNYRLLSEAEWEYAARAGSTTAYHWGNNVNNACQYGNVGDRTMAAGTSLSFVNCTDNYEWTAPVGSFQANDFGLHDMTGNAFEWTEDCVNSNYNGAPAQGSAWTSGDCGRRVLRGGSWYNYARYLRSADRFQLPVSGRFKSSGVRVARTL
jgi:formylglycine-generating enzyme